MWLLAVINIVNYQLKLQKLGSSTEILLQDNQEYEEQKEWNSRYEEETHSVPLNKGNSMLGKDPDYQSLIENETSINIRVSPTGFTENPVEG